MRSPEKYAGGARSADGSDFLVIDERWPRNPRFSVPRVYQHIVKAWGRCRGGMGAGVFPEAGGLNQQPAWLIHAFGVLDAADHRIDEIEKGGAA